MGVPLSTPAEESVRPEGNVLAVLKLSGATPPDCANDSLKATPDVPLAFRGLLTVIGDADMPKLKGSLAQPNVPALKSATLTVCSPGAMVPVEVAKFPPSML